MVRIPALSVLFVASLALAAPQQHAPGLPHAFANWTETSPPTSQPVASTSGRGADAAVLEEYGLRESTTATYASGANTATVQALQFGDATGAYGAFTFFRQPQMRPEDIGRAGSAAGGHFLVWTGVTVLDAQFSHPAVSERGALQALIAGIPQPAGPDAVPPSLPRYLPTAQLDPASVRYAIGPAAYARMGGEVPVNDIDFSQDAEAITAKYGPPNAQGTLTLIMYPTPQIATAHLNAIRAHETGIATRRIGPMVAVVDAAYPKAQELLQKIQFNDYVTINHPEGYVSEAVKVSRLLLGIATLTGILLGGALLLGIFLGGGRAVFRRLRGRPLSTVSEEEFISLHLER